MKKPDYPNLPKAYKFDLEKLSKTPIGEFAYFFTNTYVQENFEYFDKIKHLLDIPEERKSLDEIQKAKQSRLELLDRNDPDYGLKFRTIELEFEGKKHYVEEYTSFWLKSLSQRVSNSFREVMNDRQKKVWNEWIVLNRKPC